MQRNPRVALSVVDPANPYHYLEVCGKVIRIDEEKDRAFVDAMAKKYLVLDVFPWHQAKDEHVILVIQPQYTTTQNKEHVSPFSKKGDVADAKKA